MNAPTGWNKAEQAQVVASRLAPGSVINLGVGMPVSVAAAITAEQQIVFHCENGLIGYRALEENEPVDPDIIDAAILPIQVIEGAAVVDLMTSFMVARGGRLDATILGAFQVAANGDIANWSGAVGRVAGVGGAMDLAVGAKTVIAMLKHTDREGNPKIVERCTLPLTAVGCVNLIVTDLAVIRVTDAGLVVEEMAPGLTREALIAATGATLDFA
ncbi:MAG: succinyl-CoA--3-ketoacid-CoA transferase [Propionibacteriaceae bacterium]|nr:succinyl-CoA--3-ketoacid-CoA transferase [Propionibacteriaceae bacterium]